MGITGLGSIAGKVVSTVNNIINGNGSSSSLPATVTKPSNPSGTAPAAATKPASPAKGARFIGDTDGRVIDTHATPRGSYTHPDKSRTDVLQTSTHFDKKSNKFLGTTHTHEGYRNVKPETGEIRTGASHNKAHVPTYKEVQNIIDGTAKREP